jgi:hypothetical protein
MCRRFVPGTVSEKCEKIQFNKHIRVKMELKQTDMGEGKHSPNFLDRFSVSLVYQIWLNSKDV